MLDNKEVIAILNALIETSKDGEEGFRSAAKHADDDRLKDFFLRRLKEVNASVRELQELVRTLGGEPVNAPSLRGAMHRSWMNFKAVLLINNSLAVLNETERGEYATLKAYRSALHQELPAEVRAVILQQIEGVKRNHNLVKHMRDIYEAEAVMP